MDEKDKIILFLKENPEIFISGISHYFPFSDLLLDRYQDLLDWDILIYNELIEIDFGFCKKFRNKIDWKFFEPWLSKEESFYNVKNDLVDSKFLEEFKNELNWSKVCYSGSNELLSDENIKRFSDRINFTTLSLNFNKEFTVELIQRYEDKWDWEGLSANRNLPWSREFIIKYEDRWAWEFLMDNPDITWSQDILDIAEENLMPEEFENLRKSCSKIMNDDDDDDDDPLFVVDKKHIKPGYDIYTPEEFARILNDFNPALHSGDTRIPWTIALIDYYKDQWDWKLLSCNESLPWSEELIDRFFDHWYWGDKTPRLKDMNEDESDILIINTGLTGNDAIPWTNSMICKYRDYLVWHFFVHNSGIEWTIDMLIEYKPWIEKENLGRIQPVWEKVFLPYLDEEIISEICEDKRHEILAIIQEKKQRMQRAKFYESDDPV